VDDTPRFDRVRVQGYYDRHTAAFVRFGQGGRDGAIHRAVWGPGVSTRAQAFHYVEDRIADVVRSLEPPPDRALHVVDLGCGVGASLLYLAARLPILGTGITISPVQAAQAAERIRAAGLSRRVRCLEGDYTALPAGVATADVAFAIESFVHGPSPARFFAESYRLVRPGGALVLCDDFKRPVAAAGARRTLDRFVRGWHVNSLLEPEALRAEAARAGFDHVATEDLTPMLELRRPRDRAIGLLAAVAGRVPALADRLAPLVGGAALQSGLARGWLGYDLVVFRRR
jgi:SAM-dependent methyltransferase